MLKLISEGSRIFFAMRYTYKHNSLGTQCCPGPGVIVNPTVYPSFVVNYDFSFFSCYELWSDKQKITKIKTLYIYRHFTIIGQNFWKFKIWKSFSFSFQISQFLLKVLNVRTTFCKILNFLQFVKIIIFFAAF